MIFRSIQYIEAGVASLIRSIDVRTGYALQYIFFNNTPDVLTVIGALLVIAPIVIISSANLHKSSKQEVIKPV